MGPVWNEAEGFEGALVNALNAGVDLILIAMDVAQVYRALWTLHQADQQGTLDHQMLARSAERLRRADTSRELSRGLTLMGNMVDK